MKVIHLSCVAPPKIGGIGRIAAFEVEELQKRGVDAALLSPTNIPSVWTYGNTAIPNPFALYRLLKGADIVHLHYPYYGTSTIVALLRKWNVFKYLVVTAHMDATHKGFRGVVLNFHRIFFQPHEMVCADAILVSSKDYAEHSSFAKWTKRVIELPFGVDEKYFAPARHTRTAFSIPEDVRVISFVGSMDAAHPFKGVDTLVHAFKELPQNTWLVLGGEGELRVGYEHLAKELGIADRVKFLGHVAPEDLADVYRLGDVFAFPSTTAAEAFGLVALEAQACGVPVVASDLPGVRTVILDKVTGLLSPPGEARELAAHLRLLLENPGMREEFGRAARERVIAQFTWSKHMDGLIQIYKQLCESR